MVTRSDVEMVYRLFLHREPESEEVMREFLPVGSVEDLCRIFLHSDEFKAKFGRSQIPFDWPPIRIQVTVEPSLLAAMIAHVERTWSALGEADPYWSVLSVPQFRRDSFAAHADTFRDSGRIDVERFRAVAARAGLDLAHFRSCLELGCGVGRLTRWLAQMFPRVLATDISQAHLDILEQELPDGCVQRVLLSAPDTINTLPDFDVFFSLIVLQHNPPPIMALILRTVLTRLQPGGIGYFQLPTYSKDYAFDAETYLHALPSRGEMEMHVLPQAEVFAILEACGCRLLEVREDGYTGDANGLSNTFFVQKS
jgi:SAM-dependent methyltransferase